jgi:hypothetical protein
MLSKTSYSIDTELLDAALEQMPDTDFKYSINKPVGDFFYDGWQLKDEFQGTVWETLYNSLPIDKGETRIIKLIPTQSYSSHADIDDRYHLNISGNDCFIIDLHVQQMHQLVKDGIWYDMDAGGVHTAANFGNRDRYQLVSRKLLNRPTEQSSLVSVKIESKIADLEDARFYFDNTVSRFLNKVNKSKLMNNFKYSASTVSFDIHPICLIDLRTACTEYFHVRVV